MSLIKWNNSLSVNVKEIDQQHQKLVTMTNEPADAMKQRKTKDVLGGIISGLVNYTATHFTTEENYFKKLNYSEKVTHKEELDEFVKKVKEFKTGFDEGRMTLSMNIIDFLQDWLIKHIQGSDKKYSVFFNEKGLK